MELEQIRRIAVVGAGQMGQGIAQVCAQTGYTTYLADQNEELARAAIERIDTALGRQVAKGKLAADERAQTLARLEVRDLGQVARDVEVAIEAITEDRDVKRALFKNLDQQLPPSALLLSNTSSISITELARATGRPGLVAGMHFMNPVPLMRLVELVRGTDTRETTLHTVRALATRLGKTVVQSENRPGFIVNRILIPMLNEACLALQDKVALADDIDTAIRVGLNHPMGPLELSDLIGLDTVLAIARVLHRDFADEKYRPATLLEQLVQQGHLGRKTGRGFYVYEGTIKKAAPTT